MRINSSFHDYYDKCLGYGYDDSVIYNRFPKREEFARFPFQTFGRKREELVAVKSYVVGFCGKLYPVLGLQPLDKAGDDDKASRNSRKFCFSTQDVSNYVKTHHGHAAHVLFKKKQWELEDYRCKDWTFGQREWEFTQYFDGYHGERWGITHDRHKKYFDKYPLFIAESWSGYRYSFQNRNEGDIVYNGALKTVEFYRLFDANQAFQELSMWLANQAEPRKPIPTISNDDMIESKGFDLKSSFRKSKL